MLFLAMLLSSWVVARAMTWDGDLPNMPHEQASPSADARIDLMHAPARPDRTAMSQLTPWPQQVVIMMPGPATGAQPAVTFVQVPERTAYAPAPRTGEAGSASEPGGWFTYALQPGGQRLPGSEQGGDASSAATPSAPVPAAAAGAPEQAPTRSRRWSADSWMLVRRNGGAFGTAGPAPASYGASQAGAVLRYAFAPQSPHRPGAYVRVSSALDGRDEGDVALGLSARPVGKIPLQVLAEMRMARQAGVLRFRPAVLAVTQLAPLPLPLGTRADIYAQGGYVGGADATPFIDGQVKIDRKLATIGKGDLRLGAGGWGGIQKGASRVDVGPQASLGLVFNHRIPARIEMDWRLRVAGNAEPGSGPALTVSAGF